MPNISGIPGKTPKIKESSAPWVACPSCGQVLYRREWAAALQVCPSCGHHGRLSARDRVAQLTEGTLEEWDAGLRGSDPLSFTDEKPYPERQGEAEKKSGECESLVTGKGLIDGRPAALAVFAYYYMGGSMGAVLGEKFCRAAEKALAEGIPLVQVAASGGARMQEGTLSLVQMARVTSAIGELNRAGIPFVSVLTDPTTGGVAASSAMLGDVILAEPGALIGFAGPRVVEQTTGSTLPPGFQRSEFLLEHGFVDQIVPRAELKSRLGRLLALLSSGAS